MLMFHFADQCTHLFGKTAVPTFIQSEYMLEITMASDKEFLLSILEDLASVELKKFQWFLSERISDDFAPIPKSRLYDADQCDTVDLMVMFYGTAGAEKITAEVLRTMGRTDLFVELHRRCDRYAVVPAPKAKSAPKPPPEFLRRFRVQLIERMGNTRPIQYALLEQGVLTEEEIEAITVYALRAEKNRALVDMVLKKGARAQEAFYKVLREEDPYLLEELELHTSPAKGELSKPFSQIKITPEIRKDVSMYRLKCPHAGVFHCNITGLALKGEGEVEYCTIPWDKEFLSSKGKRPAGPLFEFECLKGSFSQLHLPHCETYSGARCHNLSVVHVTDDKVEFIQPHRITDKHVIISITGFCRYGLVKDNCPPGSVSPINGIVLLFYQRTNDPDLCPSIYVLLLPRNALIPQVEKEWKRRTGAEYIEALPDCELIPNEAYKVSGEPTQLIQPKVAKFLNFASYDNYTASFEVQVARDTKNVELVLRHNRRSHWAWTLFFGHIYVEVWRRGVKLHAAPPVDTTAGKMKLRDLLFGVLKRLRPKDLVTFKEHLTHCTDPLFISDLENANCMETVDRMVQKYMDGAKEKMEGILRKMNYNDLAEDLQ